MAAKSQLDQNNYLLICPSDDDPNKIYISLMVKMMKKDRPNYKIDEEDGTGISIHENNNFEKAISQVLLDGKFFILKIISCYLD